MQQSKRPLQFLLFSILTGSLLALGIYFFPPDFQLHVVRFNLQVLYLFFILLFSFLFCSVTYILKSKAHGVLISAFVIIYLLFRLNNLTHPLFLLLLAGLFIVLELFLSFKK